MRNEHRLLACLLFALGGCTPAEVAPTPRGSADRGDASLSTFLAGQGYEVVPLRRLATGHFAIDGTAGATTLTLIVDTGASHTILDVRRAARFGVVLRQERGRAAGLGVGDQPVSSAVLRNVMVGPMQLDSLAVSVLDLAHVNQTLQQMRVEPVDGIMGADLLLRRQAIIDYGTTRLYLREVQAAR